MTRTWFAIGGVVASLVWLPAGARAEPEPEVEAEAGTGEDVDGQDGAAPTGRFEIGLGFDPDEKLVFMAGVSQSDLFGTGHGLSLTSRLSGLGHRFALAYDVPDLAGTGFDLGAELSMTRRELPGFVREGAGGRLRASRALSPATRVYLGYRVERVGVELEPVQGVAALRAGSDTSEALLRGGLVSALRAGLVRDTMSSPFGHGMRAELFAETADPRLGSGLDYRRVGARALHRHHLGRGFTFSLGADASAIWSGDGRGVPLAERLHWDGHADVRGYGIGSTGPIAFVHGRPVDLGGNARASGRAELEIPIHRGAGLYAVAFYDAGMVANLDAAFAGRGAWFRHSAGIGLLWRSPIGPLRLDFAFPLGGEAEQQVLFGLGTSF